MRSYFNRGLIYKEFRNIRSIVFLNLIFMIYEFILTFINNIENLKVDKITGQFKDVWCVNKYRSIFQHFFSNGTGSHMFIIFMVIVVATFIISVDLIGEKNEVLSCMPYKREEIIITKWIMATLSIVIPAIISFLIVHLIYVMNKDILSIYVTNRMIITWSILNILVYIFVITFIMLIQILSGISVVGGVVGSIFLIFPIGIMQLISSFLRIFFSNPTSTTLSLKNFKLIESLMEKIPCVLCPVTYNLDLRLEKPNMANKLEYIKRYVESYGFKPIDIYISTKYRIVILIVCTIITFILMVYGFKKLSLEKKGYVVMFRPLEIIFKIGVSISFAILGGTIFEQYVMSSYKLNNLSLHGNINQLMAENKLGLNEYINIVNRISIGTVIVTILCGCIVYVVTNRIIKINKR